MAPKKTVNVEEFALAHLDVAPTEASLEALTKEQLMHLIDTCGPTMISHIHI